LQAGERHLEALADARQGQRHHALAEHDDAASEDCGGDDQEMGGYAKAAHGFGDTRDGQRRHHTY
jgi:hypothetical protein